MQLYNDRESSPLVSDLRDNERDGVDDGINVDVRVDCTDEEVRELDGLKD